jgi:hypothetical protein
MRVKVLLQLTAEDGNAVAAQVARSRRSVRFTDGIEVAANPASSQSQTAAA